MYHPVDSPQAQSSRAALAEEAAAKAEAAAEFARLACDYDRWGLAPEALDARAEARRLQVACVILRARAAVARA